MRGRIINFLFLIILSLGMSSCKVAPVEIDVPSYTITIDNQVEGVIFSGIINGNSYTSNSYITIKADNIPSNYTIKWERSDGVVYCGDNYSFIMPSYNLTITINLSIYSREGDKIYFGEYPQTEVKDLSLINELNILAGEKPKASNTYNWTDYKYYINDSIISFMYYQDIDYDNDGTFDYRGVYFTQYRPYFYSYSSSLDYTFQDDNGYYTNTIYWFSYDPIEWDILKEENGKALIITNLILDSQEYYPSFYSFEFEHNGGKGYANNYELSNIRKFLNDNFYNTAFNDLQKEIIKITKVDNSESSNSSNSNDYACNDTNDKMFLLSYKEVTTYYSSSSEIMAQGSDYAKSQGLYVDSSTNTSHWWLRKFGGATNSDAFIVYNDGYINLYGIYATVGVRPVCQIIL